MLYQSTRSSEQVTDTAAVLRGIAPDGGLYIDPKLGERPFDWRGCLGLSALGMAEKILSHLLPGYADMGALVARAYAGKFETEDLTPLVKVGEDYVLELFRGPTAAFKDVALSMLPQLVTAAREQEGVRDKIVILTATSGDTGKAALEGFHDVAGTGILVFYPHGGVSPVQRAQMVTQSGANVKVCAVRGNFDDCQSGVKQAFAAIGASGALEGTGRRLSSANSINIGRLAPQVVYYFIAYAELVRRGAIACGERVDYVVPTGNFGDILAGYFARLMGLPVGRLVCASNANRVLTDFLTTGVYDKRRPFLKTSSPSAPPLPQDELALDGHPDLLEPRASALPRDRRRRRAGGGLDEGASGDRHLPRGRRDPRGHSGGVLRRLLRRGGERGDDRPHLARQGLSLRSAHGGRAARGGRL